MHYQLVNENSMHSKVTELYSLKKHIVEQCSMEITSVNTEIISVNLITLFVLMQCSRLTVVH